MAAFIGIDLGTTFSAAAAIDETGRPYIIHNKDGSNLTPSCVEFHDDGTYDVGELARKGLFVPGSNALGRFKRSMGTSAAYEVLGRTITPTQLSTFVLRRILDDTQAALGTIGDAVVTIPANFAHEAREATLVAARAAGLKVNFIINEPTAAALYYAYKSGQELGGTYAVYDLGGGTFDVSVIRVEGQDVEVLASNGVPKLGGDDFDEALQRIVQAKFKVLAGEFPDPEDFTKNDSEEEKKSLSRRDSVTLRVARRMIEVSRSEFEEAISSKVAQAEMLCEATLDEAGIKPGKLQGVFLAGGSTRIPLVMQSVSRVFGQEPISTVNVDEVVALGAALYAAYKGDRSSLSAAQRNSIQRIKVRETTNMCFGTIAIGHDAARDEAKLMNSVLIRKGEKIPCAVTESFYTVRAGQEGVACRVTESRAPETDLRFVKVIWKGELPLPPGRPEEQEIKVTFAYDENQIMKCSFVDVATGRETKVDLSMASNSEAGENEVNRFLVE